jgi:hypothetical protein
MLILDVKNIKPTIKKGKLFYESNKDYYCPCCHTKLIKYGTKTRTCKVKSKCVHDDQDNIYNWTFNNMEYRIQRMRCSNCKRIDHILPDIIVPFKRLSTCIVQHCITVEIVKNFEGVQDISTIYKIKRWFKASSGRLAACRDSYLARRNPSEISQSIPTKLEPKELKNEKHWLKELILEVTNFTDFYIRRPKKNGKPR